MVSFKTTSKYDLMANHLYIKLHQEMLQNIHGSLLQAQSGLVHKGLQAIRMIGRAGPKKYQKENVELFEFNIIKYTHFRNCHQLQKKVNWKIGI